MSSNYEAFLRGEPLTPELAKLKEQGQFEPEPAAKPEIHQESTEIEFSDRERKYLQKLRKEPGWPVFLRLLEKDIHMRERSAMLLSQNDPLLNRDRIANEWSYVAIYKQMDRRIENLINEEILKLDDEAETQQ